MMIVVRRLVSDDESTLGLLYINGQKECFTLEDEYREEKVMKETRIPEGTYKVVLHKAGRLHEKYIKKAIKYNFDHHGMLLLKDVPGFVGIMIHIGNYETDTAGCLLVGDQPGIDDRKHFCVLRSTDAYIKLYKKISDHILDGGRVLLSIMGD